MTWDKNTILGEISASKGYDVAFLTTYNFEVRFFEEQVLSVLLGNNIRIVNLFADSKELNKEMSHSYSRVLGREYFVTPVFMNGAFHPKVVLLLGDGKAKLIISSANIKTSGYIFNNEVFNTFEYSSNNTTYANIIASAIDFFKQLYTEAHNNDNEARKKLSSFKISENDGNDLHLLFNAKESIINQLKDIIHEEVKRINIAVPFYDSTLEAIKNMQTVFSCSDCHLFIQNGKSTFPNEYNLLNKIVSESSVHLFNSVSDQKTSTAFYHGKVIEFVTNEYSYILYGSANCSANALTRAKPQNGNIECCILVRGEPDANTSFFGKFDVDKTASFEPGFTTEATLTKDEYTFIYGESGGENSHIRLYLHYQKITPVEVYYNETQLEYSYVDSLMEIVLPFDVYDSRSSVFTITLKHNDTVYKVPCWFNDLATLNYNRFADRLIELPYISNTVDLREYMPYIEPVAKALFDNDWYKVAEENEDKKEVKTINPDDEDVNDINDDFILKEDIQDDYIEKTYLTSIFRNVQVLSGRYTSLIAGRKAEKDPKKQNVTVLKYPTHAKKKEDANRSERWLGRFYKRNIRVMLSSENKASKTYSEYKYMFGTILDNIQLIFYNQRKVGFLDHEYIIDVKTRYSYLILEKMKEEQNFEDYDYLISFIILTALERKKYISEDDWDAQVLFDRATSIKNIRESFQEYLNDEKLTSILVFDNTEITDEEYQNGINDMMTYAMTSLDSMFHYMTFEQLNYYLKKRYGSNTEVTITGHEFVINIVKKDSDFNTEMSLADRDLVEVESYINGYQLSMNTIRFSFKKKSDDKRIDFCKRGNKVIRKYYNGTNITSFYCILMDNKAWRIDYNNKIKS